MSEPQAAPEAAAPSAPSGNASIMEILESVANERAAKETPATPAPAARPAPKGFIDPLSDEHFDEAKLSTPEGIKAARELLQAELKAAKDIRQKAHNARAEAERREGKFKGTKQQVLAEKAAVTAQMNLLRQELGEIQSGDPARFTSAIARLANKSDDPVGFWREVATHIATGKKPEVPQSPEVAELKARLQRMEDEKTQERTAAQEYELDQRILAARQAQLEEAKTYTDLQYVSHFANEQPALVDARLVEIRQEHHKRTGQSLDLRAAAGIVEEEIKSHFEMLQRAGNPSGAMNGARGAAAPEAGQARLPERQIANPESTPSASAQNRSVPGIPASLAAAPASNTRPLSKAEEKAAITAALDKMGLFGALGM
jgi:hypothetical protein